MSVREFIFSGREHIPFHIFEYFRLRGYHCVEDQGGRGVDRKYEEAGRVEKIYTQPSADREPSLLWDWFVDTIVSLFGTR